MIKLKLNYQTPYVGTFEVVGATHLCEISGDIKLNLISLPGSQNDAL